MNEGRYGFYELLAQAALEHLAGNQPEPEDARPLLRAMLTRAFLMLEVAKEHHASQEIGDRRWDMGDRGVFKIKIKIKIKVNLRWALSFGGDLKLNPAP